MCIYFNFGRQMPKESYTADKFAFSFSKPVMPPAIRLIQQGFFWPNIEVPARHAHVHHTAD